MSRSWSTFFEHGCAIIIFFFFEFILTSIFKISFQIIIQNSNWSNILDLDISLWINKTKFARLCNKKKTFLELKTFGPVERKNYEKKFFSRTKNLHNFIIFNFLLVVLILLFLEKKNKSKHFFTDWLFWKFIRKRKIKYKNWYKIF